MVGWGLHIKFPLIKIIHLYNSGVQEEDKIRLAEESGLELKQINNWFINQRKRNWQAEQNNNASNNNTTIMNC